MMIISITKTYEGSMKVTGNGQYIVKARFYNIVMMVHSSLTTLGKK